MGREEVQPIFCLLEGGRSVVSVWVLECGGFGCWGFGCWGRGVRGGYLCGRGYCWGDRIMDFVS